MAKTAFAKNQLQSFINRIERLNEEREALSADIREVFAEAKGTGFDVKIMRQVIRMRKLDKADFQEQEAMLDLYLTAMDMRDGAPLLDYAEQTEIVSDKEADQVSPRGAVAEASSSSVSANAAIGAVTAPSVTGGESAAPMEIPAFLVRNKPPPEPVPA